MRSVISSVLVGTAIHRVTPEYVRGMQAPGAMGTSSADGWIRRGIRGTDRSIRGNGRQRL